MNKNKAHKIVDEILLKEPGKTCLHRIIDALSEPDCKHNDLSLRDNGKHECLNCGVLFSVEKLR